MQTRSIEASEKAVTKMQSFHAETIDQVKSAIGRSDVVVVGMAQNPHVKNVKKGDFVTATVRRPGGSIYDLIGTNDMTSEDTYYERGINPWDIAAGELLCARAGLQVVRLEPQGELPWGLAVAPPAFADELLALVG